MASEKFKLTGSPEKQLAQVERYLRHLGRRKERVATVVVPPYPISSYSESPEPDEKVFRFISPVNGKILKCVLKIDEQSKDLLVSVKTELMNDAVSTVQNYTVVKGKPIEFLGGDIKKAGCFSVSISYLKTDKTIVKGVWIGVLFQASRATGEVEKLLIDDLLKEVEESEDA